jgi:hypothetical protein
MIHAFEGHGSKFDPVRIYARHTYEQAVTYYLTYVEDSSWIHCVFRRWKDVKWKEDT